MAKKYIDANKMADELSKVPWYEREDEKQAVRMVKEFPAVDVVEVCRCKDCKHRYVGGYTTQYYVCDFMDAELKDEGYCSYGERKDG